MKSWALNMRRTYVEAIKKQELLLNFSVLLHPLNEKDQKNKFLSSEIENPIFTYNKTIIPNFTSLEIAGDEPIDQLYRDRINLTKNLTDLINSIGDDEKFSKLSKKIFPIKEIFLPAFVPINNESSDNQINAEDVRKRFLKELDDLNIAGWGVEIVDNISSRMVVSYPRKEISIIKDIQINKEELEELVRHEIRGHVLRSSNGNKQREPLLHVGTAKGRLFEEGVSCFLENPKGPSRIFLRHQAVLIAQKYGFKEVYNHLIKKGLPKEEAWAMTVRVKRGLIDTSKPGGFTRDAIYAQAFTEMQEYINNGGDISALLAAPIHPDEISCVPISIQPEVLNNKRILMIGFRGKQSHIKTAKEKGIKFDLLIDKSEMKEEYKKEFGRIYVLDDIFDWNEIESAVLGIEYDGILTRFEDFTVLVSAIGEYLNIPAISFEDSIKFRNKYCMRKAFAEKNVPSADFALVSSINDANEMIEKHGFPLIIKQISGIHSKYVKKVKNRDELNETINFFLASLKNENGTLHGTLKNYPENIVVPDHKKNLLLEECLTGEELTVDAFVVNGKIFLTPVCKYVLAHEMGMDDHHLPIRIMPYDIPENHKKRIFETVESSLKALGADFCVAHVELFFNAKTKESSVIEVAARGGGFRAEMVSSTCNGDFDLGIVRAAMGLPPNVKNISKKYAAVVEVFSPQNGILKQIDASCIQNRSDISHITWNKNIGEDVGKASEGRSFILKFLVEAKTYEDVKINSEELLKKIQGTIEVKQ